MLNKWAEALVEEGEENEPSTLECSTMPKPLVHLDGRMDSSPPPEDADVTDEEAATINAEFYGDVEPPLVEQYFRLATLRDWFCRDVKPLKPPEWASDDSLAAPGIVYDLEKDNAGHVMDYESGPYEAWFCVVRQDIAERCGEEATRSVLRESQIKERTAPAEAKDRSWKTRRTRSWTQPTVDRAIAEYVSKHSPQLQNYASVLNDPKKKPEVKKVIRKQAQKLFGRNVIADALRVSEGSRSMVSKSQEWIKVADLLGFSLSRNQIARGTRDTLKQGRIGLEIADEQRSEDEAAAPENALIVDEEKQTLRAIRRLAESGKPDAKKEVEELLAKYQAGEITDEQVRQIVKMQLE